MTKKTNKRNKTNKKYGYIALVSVVIVLIIVLFSSKYNPLNLMGNMYNIDQLEANIDSIQPGDTINYEINGYSDWQVLYVDKKNNTIDVVSKTNTENIELI